ALDRSGGGQLLLFSRDRLLLALNRLLLLTRDRRGGRQLLLLFSRDRLLLLLALDRQLLLLFSGHRLLLALNRLLFSGELRLNVSLRIRLLTAANQERAHRKCRSG